MPRNIHHLYCYKHDARNIEKHRVAVRQRKQKKERFAIHDIDQIAEAFATDLEEINFE